MKKGSPEFLIHAAHEIATTSALEAGAICYIPRVMAIASLPFRDPQKTEYVRTNGQCTLTILAPSSTGIPFGSFPRLLLIEIATRSKIEKTKEIFLANSSAALLKKLKGHDVGGLNGTRRTLTRQCQRLFSSSISLTCACNESWHVKNRHIVASASLFWKPASTQRWTAEILLDEEFFHDIQTGAIPVDGRVVGALSNHPFAMDLYFWLTYRYAFLRHRTVISWKQLSGQFGSNISSQSNFKHAFMEAINKVCLLYHGIKYSRTESGLMLHPGKPHIPRMTKRKVVQAVDEGTYQQIKGF